MLNKYQNRPTINLCLTKNHKLIHKDRYPIIFPVSYTHGSNKWIELVGMEHKEFSFKIEPVTETELTTYDTPSLEERPIKVRLDKWLWAARFFKTRALARSAIEQGKVLYDGQKTSPTTEITTGIQVTIFIGGTKKCISIAKLSTRRRNSIEANELYTEIATRKQVKFLRSGNIHRSQSRQDQQYSC